MTLDDRAYFLRRVLQEEEAARISTCPEARERHLELAEAYRFRCRATEIGSNQKQVVDDEIIAQRHIMLPAA